MGIGILVIWVLGFFIWLSVSLNNKKAVKYAQEQAIQKKLAEQEALRLRLLQEAEQQRILSQKIAEKSKSALEKKFEEADAHYEKTKSLFMSMTKEELSARAISVERQPLGNMPFFSATRVTKATSWKTYSDFVSFDVETTGLRAHINEIIEIAAVRFRNDKPSSYFHTYVKPLNGLRPDAERINGVNEDMVKDAPCVNDICGPFIDFIGKDNLIAHNINFDLKFLYSHGIPFYDSSRKYYDTLELAKKYFHKMQDITGISGYPIGGYSLSNLTADFNIFHDDQHSALSDACACGFLFIDLCNELKNL